MNPSTAVYIRVSTCSQNAAGQRSEIVKWLKGNCYKRKDVIFFVDKQTGDNLDRPELKKLQQMIFNGQIKTVVVWKLDRLSRSLKDGINTLCDWCEKNIRVVSVTQQLDFSGAGGKLIASVLFAVAEMEQETRRERQAAGIAIAKKKGKYKGRKPGTTKMDPRVVYRMRKSGLTYKRIMEKTGLSRRTAARYVEKCQPENPSVPANRIHLGEVINNSEREKNAS